MSKEMRIKAKRDQTLQDKRRREEKMTRTKNTILKSRNDMVSLRYTSNVQHCEVYFKRPYFVCSMRKLRVKVPS